MTHFEKTRTAVVAVLGVALGSMCFVACSEARSGFRDGKSGFDQETSADAGACLLQCSLDGRSVIQTCTGMVVETCSADLACGAGVCQEPCAAATADKSSNGCEFYLQPPRFTKGIDQSCYAAYVVNSSNKPAELSLELGGEALDLSKSVYRTNPGDATLVEHTGPVAVGETVLVFISDRSPEVSASSSTGSAVCPTGIVPATYADALPDGTGIGTSFHLTANVPVSLAAIYPFGGASSFTPSATLLLPVGTWGTEHIIVNAWERITYERGFMGRGPAAQIVASEDDTVVKIRPTRAIQNGIGVVGTAKQVAKSYRLRKGQVLQINQAEELSGSTVVSNKPTSVFGGHECMFIPSARQACDMALQQLPPFAQWGSEYVGVGYRPRLGDPAEPMPYRIVAARDGTVLDYDPEVPPGAPLTMSAGEVATFWSTVSGGFVVRTQDAEHPIYLSAHMAGGGLVEGSTDYLGKLHFDGHGDPEFVNVVPAGQYLSSYSFYADPTYDETSLVVVRAKSRGEFKDVWLECAGNLTDFQPIGTRGEYEYTRVDLSRRGGPGDTFGDSVCRTGLQRMRSDGPFTATLWGWAKYASYAYPGGMAQRKLVDAPLDSVR